MITKIVWNGGMGTCTYAGDDYYGEASEESYYAVGWRQPNYPVPAINQPAFNSNADGCIEWWLDGRIFWTLT